MRVLAASDVHGRVEDVRRLRALEPDRFDAVVAAGDLCGAKGEDAAAEVLGVLGSFGCPVLFVLGNWDRRVAYAEGLFAPAIHLHGHPTRVGRWWFAGYSGCDAGWGHNPVARRMTEAFRERQRAARGRTRGTGACGSDGAEAGAGIAEGRARDAERRALGAAIRAENAREAARLALEAGAEPGRTAFVSHDRTPRLRDAMPGLRLHLFGHLHRFAWTRSGGMDSVNVAALDRREAVTPGGGAPVNRGTYAVIELSGDGGVRADGIRLWPDATAPA